MYCSYFPIPLIPAKVIHNTLFGLGDVLGGIVLVLSRRVNESLLIDKEIKITVLDIKGGQVRLGISAPPSIEIHREEVFDRIQKDSSEDQES